MVSTLLSVNEMNRRTEIDEIRDSLVGVSQISSSVRNELMKILVSKDEAALRQVETLLTCAAEFAAERDLHGNRCIILSDFRHAQKEFGKFRDGWQHALSLGEAVDKKAWKVLDSGGEVCYCDGWNDGIGDYGGKEADDNPYGIPVGSQKAENPHCISVHLIPGRRWCPSCGYLAKTPPREWPQEIRDHNGHIDFDRL